MQTKKPKRGMRRYDTVTHSPHKTDAVTDFNRFSEREGQQNMRKALGPIRPRHHCQRQTPVRVVQNDRVSAAGSSSLSIATFLFKCEVSMD
jgi:hypothetical protein